MPRTTKSFGLLSVEQHRERVADGEVVVLRHVVWHHSPVVAECGEQLV